MGWGKEKERKKIFVIKAGDWIFSVLFKKLVLNCRSATEAADKQEKKGKEKKKRWAAIGRHLSQVDAHSHFHLFFIL